MNSKTQIQGIHHVTAIASDPQVNVDFYAGLLGLRLVKKTVNFDDPTAYHLYYADGEGTPGSVVTFFYWPQGAGRGRVGSGQMTRISFSTPAAALDYWGERLATHGVVAQREERFAETVLRFADPDGIPLEIVAVAQDGRAGWTGAGIPAEYAIRGLHTAELTVRASAPTSELLTEEMAYRVVRTDGNRTRYEVGAGGAGTYIDLIANVDQPHGLGGVGTIHHIAWRVADDATELELLRQLRGAGYHVSPVMDRDYFHSIYYRERGGILFEIATANPGFAVDEAPDALGTGLMLPKQFEHARDEIEVRLPQLRPAQPTTPQA